jgi:excisionase family DNA binding protein
MLTVKQAAERLGVSPALIYALVSARKIRHERHGLRRGAIRIPEDALDEYRRRCTVDVGEEDGGGGQEEGLAEPAAASPKRKGPGIDLW